jgi:uncharacterized protein (TIGR00255 family)
MTGFGRATFEVEGGAFVLEARSLNHRYLDAQLRLPRGLGAFEPELRARLKERFARGRFEVSVLAGSGVATARVHVDPGVVSQYVAAAEAIRRTHPVAGQLDLATLLTLPGVASFADAELAEEPLRRGLVAALDEAGAALEAMRRSEGELLARDLRARLERVLELAADVESRSAEVQAVVRDRLHKRLEELQREAGVVDPGRLHQELALAADRLDVSEELVRLRSHVAQFRSLLDAEGPVGRRLDFLSQELAREANTLGSKAGDAPVAHLVVELKAELERIREQVQNVE